MSESRESYCDLVERAKLSRYTCSYMLCSLRFDFRVDLRPRQHTQQIEIGTQFLSRLL